MSNDSPKHNGFIILNKASGWSSFDAVARMRSILKIKKIGHGGTLDPAASGVLVLCCGKATRLSKYLLHGDKRYRATIRLGRTTETYDTEGEFSSDFRTPPGMNQTKWTELLSRFTGGIKQIPPRYSAKKTDGKRHYELARQGRPVEPKAVGVTIYAINIQAFDSDWIELDISCGSGTYIRSLAHDIGQALGCGGYLEKLIRTESGEFSLDQAISIEKAAEFAGEDDYSFVRAADQLVPAMRKIPLNAGQTKRFLNGNFITLVNPLLSDKEETRVYADDGHFLGIGEVEKPFGTEQVKIWPRIVIA